MKLQYKHQKFQADAAQAVVDVFAGQPYLTPSYMIDRGAEQLQPGLMEEELFTGWKNERVVPELTDAVVLERVRKIQRNNLLKPSEQLEGRANGYNLTIEMETGVGKTYTYIKTMYELNKQYGWSKFIIVVPSIAIREGVYKSFQTTEEHFAEEYGKKIRYFIYNSAQLTEIDRFASDNSINVMIINAQAFNATGKDARRIYMKLDEFRSRRPIDIIAKTNPILIIDEPQSVEGKKTKENLKQFHPMITLRYSATHKLDSIYNMIYRLDAIEAYNKQLVKKISVKAVTASGTTATESYVYLQSVNVSDKAPTATIQFDCKTKSGIKQVTKTVGQGFNLHDHSNGLDEYKDGFVVSFIDGRDNSVSFINGLKLFAGDVTGKVSEEQLRRIQIRETILSHIERERELFYKGIKVLSLFFIDEVAHYKEYDAAGQPRNGIFAKMFEEEYNDVVNNLQMRLGEKEYKKYLSSIRAEDTHAGYFSIDKKGRLTNSKVNDRKEKTSDDIDAYDLIMKNKELLLERDPKKSPVRFIFSHSALREGWDNPNVFQICTLKQSGSEVRKRQEVGRGLRLCVNRDGERMDSNALGSDVHKVNVLTVIASESYDSFARGLQNEIAEAVSDRPRRVTADLFEKQTITDAEGNTQIVDKELANTIYRSLSWNHYIDDDGLLTDTYYEDKKNGNVKVADKVKECAASIIAILDSVYDSRIPMAEDARANNVEAKLDEDKLAMKEFKELWDRINAKSAYVVDFDSGELIQKSIARLNAELRIAGIYVKVVTGAMNRIESKEALQHGESFVLEKRQDEDNFDIAKNIAENSSIKYDLIGKLVEETGLTRKDVVAILTGIDEKVFMQFKDNPEDFILKAARLINEEKATVIVQHITYNKLKERHDTDIFTEPALKGKLDHNAIKTKKHLYDHLIFDSDNEKKFAEQLDVDSDVAVYVKLPGGFYISTPVGKYNPDWAIAFYEGNIKHIYFVAETKGSMSSMQLREIEKSKIYCATEHFKAISGDNVKYHVVDSYEALKELVKG